MRSPLSPSAQTLRLIVERKIYFKTRGCGPMTNVDAGSYNDVRRQQQFAGPRPRLARSKSYNFQASTGPCLHSDSVTGDDVICWCPPLGVRANRCSRVPQVSCCGGLDAVGLHAAFPRLPLTSRARFRTHVPTLAGLQFGMPTVVHSSVPRASGSKTQFATRIMSLQRD